MGSIHNTRILRFFIATGAVVLTIFIYASYSTGPTLTQPHMRAHMPLSPAALLQQQQQLIDKSNELFGSVAGGSSYLVDGGTLKVNNSSRVTSSQSQTDSVGISSVNVNSYAHDEQKKKDALTKKNILHLNEIVAPKKTHRLPTIDVDAGGADVSINTVDDMLPADEAALDRLISNDLLEEQYSSNLDNTLGNINSSSVSTPDVGNNAQLLQQQQQLQRQQQQQQQQQQSSDNSINNKYDGNNANKVLETDVLIPTSNLQKFIENADKILKNITVTVNTSPPNQHDQQRANNTSVGNNKLYDAPKSVVGDGNKAPGKVEELSDNGKEINKNKVVEVINHKDNVKTVGVDVNIDDDNNNNDDSDDPKPPSVVMTIKGAGTTEEKKTEPQEQKQNQNIQKKTTAVATKPASAPPAPADHIIALSKSNKQNAKATTTKPIDPKHGILTQHIYESGHLDNEISIDKICPNNGADIKLLILITSAETHAVSRLAIRQTWGHYGIRRDVSTAFVLGRSTNQKLNASLTEENYIYGDLIRGNFIDSYNNLTLKTISLLEWVDTHCADAKFILKTDDDMFINVPKLLNFLDNQAKSKPKRIYGRLAKKWKPIRNEKSKYYVSPEQFSAAVFPEFTTGPAYVMTNDIVHDLYERSLQQVYLKLEDVFTTGIVAQQLNIRRVHVNEFLNRRIAIKTCNLRKAISVHMIKSNEQFNLWKMLLDQTTNCK